MKRKKSSKKNIDRKFDLFDVNDTFMDKMNTLNDVFARESKRVEKQYHAIKDQTLETATLKPIKKLPGLKKTK